MSDTIRIKTETLIGRNRHGYTFAVGLVDEGWLGYARGGGGLFAFGIGDGFNLTHPDREEAIRRTSAFAQAEPSYGGVEEWLVPERVRGNPDDYRCAECDELCCPWHDADDDGDGE